MNYKLSILHHGRTLNLHNDNVDIEVILEDGQTFSATLFTRANIDMLLDKYKKSGECANGIYFWAADLILVNDLKEMTIKTVVADLIDSGELKFACTKISV